MKSLLSEGSEGHEIDNITNEKQSASLTTKIKSQVTRKLKIAISKNG